MAKPRVFISSTFYDLRQIRVELDKFIESLGYEPIRNEEGDIPYGKDEALQEYCYKEITNVDNLKDPKTVIDAVTGDAIETSKEAQDNFDKVAKPFKKPILGKKEDEKSPALKLEFLYKKFQS